MSDGTSDRNQHYQAHHMSVKDTNGDCRTMFLGMLKQNTHTAAQNAHDWEISIFEDIRAVWNASPLAQDNTVAQDQIFALICGLNSDHASEMKLTARKIQEIKQRIDRVKRGQLVIQGMTQEQLREHSQEVSSRCIEDAGGSDCWEQLSDTEHQSRTAAAQDAVAQRLGQQCFAQLPQAEQQSVDFWLWFGCFMHKELNLVVAGNEAMMAYWSSAGLTGPMLLPNKDNAATIAAGSSDAQKRAEKVSTCGAAKMLDLFGTVVRNKDTKSGTQRTYNSFMEDCVGYPVEYPNTSRNRFQSTCAAACDVVMYRLAWLDFLDTLRWKKQQPGFTNIEQNVFSGLSDGPTLTECGALALLSQCLTVPFVKDARTAGTNATTLGPLLCQLDAQARKLYHNPGLVTEAPPDVSHCDAVLNGEDYPEKAVIYAVQYHMRLGLMEHLNEVFQALLKGVIDKLPSFMAEYAADSPLSHATAEDLDRVFFPSTNDANEGILGYMRQWHRHRPNVSDAILNASAFYTRNGTGKWLAEQPSTVHEHIMVLGRSSTSAEQARTERRGEIEHLQRLAEEHRIRAHEKAEEERRKREELTRRLDEYEPQRILDYRLVTISIKADILKQELEWHRHRGLPQTHANCIPMVKARLKLKADQVNALASAIKSFADAPVASNTPMSLDTEPPHSMTATAQE